MNKLKIISFFIFIILFSFSFADSTDIRSEVYVIQEAVPVSSVDSGGGIPALFGNNSLKIVNFEIKPSGTSAIFNIDSNNPSKYVVFFGETPSLEKGAVLYGQFSKNHNIYLDNLLPDKRYYYKIQLEDSAVVKTDTGVRSFETSPLFIDFEKINNISNLSYDQKANGIFISWNYSDFGSDYYFRVLRSYKFYPRDPYDGIPVYEGKENYFTDTYDLIEGANYFYSVFVCNNTGLCSTGNSFDIVFKEKKPDYVFSPGNATTSSEITDKFSADIKVLVGEEEVLPVEGFYRFYVGKDIRIKLLPENPPIEKIKNIILKIVPEDKKLNDSVYLFNFNKDSGYFETSGFRLSSTGDYRLDLGVFGSDKSTIATGIVKFQLHGDDYPSDSCGDGIFSWIRCYWYLLLIIILPLILFKLI